MKTALTNTQKQAIESIDQNILVTAGAGSGKTLVLVQRYVEILQKQPELSVHNLLAVTYTRKAAKEMRTRIKARLKELYEQAKIDGTKEHMRWHQCLADMDLANIETIHSFCQSLVRAFTVEIGLNPQLEILDEIERAQIVEESIAETLRQIITADSTSKVILEHYPLDTLETFIKEALHHHLQFEQIMTNWQSADRDDFIAQINALLTKTQKQLLADLTIDEEWHSAGNYLKFSTFPKNIKLEEVRQQAAQYYVQIQESVQTSKINETWQVLLSLPELGPLRMGGNSDEAKEMRAAIKTLIEKSKDYSQSKKKGYGLPANLPDDLSSNDNYWQFWQALLAIVKQAQSIYSQKKREAGKFDFDDLIAMTKSVLEEPHSAVRKYYNDKLAHILVDEFQDTNPIQAEIISLLAGEKTKLFLIGDDKQSIYKFQGADVATFNAWQSNSDNNLVFADSFRSQPNIVNFVNSIFAVLLHKRQAHVDYRAKYSPLEAKREAAAQVEIMQLPTLTDGNLTEDRAEGRAVANWIEEKVNEEAEVLEKHSEKRPINYGDFAVLVPRNRDLQIFESALGEAGIPYVTSGGRTFLERQEIYDLENMLLFLSNPSNSHALLGVLRSPMFGVSDDVIHNLLTVNISVASPRDISSQSESLWQKMQDFLSKEENRKAGYQNIAGAIIVLKRLLTDLSKLSLPQLVYKIIRDTNYDLIALTLPDGKQRYKNIWKFYTMVTDDLDAGQFAERLALSRELSVREGNATIDNKQSVKLMTIHSAKGLEFPAVALPVLSNAINYNKSKLLFHQQFGIVLNTTRTEQERDEGVPLAYQLGKTIDDDMDIAEKKRLLYVAMTRARDYLSLFIAPENIKANSAAEWLVPLLESTDRNNSGFGNTELEDRDKRHHEWRTADISESRTNSKGKDSDEKNNDAKNGELANNLDEQLLEPVLLNLPSQTMPPESLSSLGQRITPSEKHNQPSAILLGKYFHKIMQYLHPGETKLSEDKLVALAEQFAEEAVHPAFKQALLEEGKKLLSIYANSKLQKLFYSAKSICHEWSYYINSQADQLYLNRPDLLLETADSIWYLIDYKTDRFALEDLESQISQHRAQLQRYGEDFRQLTNIQPRLAIYFAQNGTLHEL